MYAIPPYIIVRYYVYWCYEIMKGERGTRGPVLDVTKGTREGARRFRRYSLKHRHTLAGNFRIVLGEFQRRAPNQLVPTPPHFASSSEFLARFTYSFVYNREGGRLKG